MFHEGPTAELGDSLTPPACVTGHGCSLIVPPAHHQLAELSQTQNSHPTTSPTHKAWCATMQVMRKPELDWRRLCLALHLNMQHMQGELPRRAFTAADLCAAHAGLQPTLAEHLRTAAAIEAGEGTASPTLYPVLVLLCRLRCLTCTLVCLLSLQQAFSRQVGAAGQCLHTCALLLPPGRLPVLGALQCWCCCTGSGCSAACPRAT